MQPEGGGGGWGGGGGLVTLQWIESYLSEIKKYVYLNEHSSDLRKISCGIPQGSVLGPLLFLAYITDLNISRTFFYFLPMIQIFIMKQIP